MDAQIAALEEEVAILKGEIKSVLQEMRTAILASENPFTGGSLDRPTASAPTAEGPSETKVIQLPTPPSANMPPPPAREPWPSTAVPMPADAAGPGHVVTGEETDAYRPGPMAQAGHARPPEGDVPYFRPGHRLAAPDVLALAALLTWVEETRERLDESRYRVVLGLARYGELIDDELEKTLLEAAETVGGAAAGARASTNDSIMALRQLEAILAPDANGGRPANLNDYAFDRLRPGKETRPSRRQ